MDHVLLDRSSGSFEFPKRDVYGGGGCRRGLGARPARARGAHAHGSFHTCSPPYLHVQKGGAWSSAPVLPYGRPPIYSSPSLPLLPSNQPPLLPLPPTATKHASTFPYPPPAPARTSRPEATTTTTVPAAAAVASSRQRDRRRRPVRPPPPAEPSPSSRQKKPLERATPLPPAQVVTEALDDLEQEVARSFVQDLLHALAPPPSSLPLPRFSLVMKASPSAALSKLAPPPPSCNAEAATADGLRCFLRL